MVQLAAYIDLLLASLLAVGAVSALGYAQVFYLLPISLFGMSVAAAELPELSRLAAGTTAGSPGATVPAAMTTRLAEGLARIAFFVVPISVAYLVIGDLVVGALLQTGEFDANDTRLVWLVLGGFTVGLIATTSSRLLQNTLYATGRRPDAGPGRRHQRRRLRRARRRPDVPARPGPARRLPRPRPPARPPAPAARRRSGRAVPSARRRRAAIAASVSSWVEFFLLRRRLRGLGSRSPSAAGSSRGWAWPRPWWRWSGSACGRSWTTCPPLLALPLAAGPAAVAYLGITLALGVPEAVALVGRFWTRPAVSAPGGGADIRLHSGSPAEEGVPWQSAS